MAQAVHLPLIERLRDTFEIARDRRPVAEPDAAIGDRYQVPPERRFGSLEELLTAPGLDALVILTTGSHGAGGRSPGSIAGLAVFAEKPLAYTRAEADAIASGWRPIRAAGSRSAT